MAVNQAGASCRAMASDLCRSPIAIHIRGIAPCVESAVDAIRQFQQRGLDGSCPFLAVSIIPMFRSQFCRGV